MCRKDCTWWVQFRNQIFISKKVRHVWLTSLCTQTKHIFSPNAIYLEAKYFKFTSTKTKQKIWILGLWSKEYQWKRCSIQSFLHYQKWIWFTGYQSPAKPATASIQWTTSQSSETGVFPQTNIVKHADWYYNFLL